MTASQLAKLENRIAELGKDLGRERKLRKNGEAAEGAVTAPAAVTPDDLRAALQLGRVLASLPARAAAHVEELQANGTSYSEALRTALAMQIMTENAPVTGVSSEGVTPKANLNGVAATAASRTAPAHPRSLSEYAALARQEPERFKALKNDPTFDPSALPNAIR